MKYGAHHKLARGPSAALALVRRRGRGISPAGVAAFFALKDRILLGLSFSLALFTFLRCLSIYRVVSSGAYEVVEGVCVELKHKTFQKQQNVLLMSLDGVEHRLTLDKRTHLRIGNRYRFYFKPADTAYVDGLPQSLRPQDLLLGMEDLGGYCAEQESSSSQQE